MNIRTMVLSLLATCAIGAVASASASAALPEQVPASGKLTISSGASVFETKAGEKVSCTKDSGSGEITGAKTSTGTVTFEGCTASLLGVKIKCQTGAEGDIVTELKNELVYINKSKKEVGLDSVLAKELTIKCGSFETLKVKGSTICPISPINTKTKTLTLSCKQKKGVQEPTEYENAKGEKVKDITETKGEGLKTFAFEQSGLESTETLTLATEGEIKG